MTRYSMVITERERARAHRLIDAAPEGTRMDLVSERRSLPQNALMWARLTDIAQQLKWHGQTLRPDDWKLVFMDGLNREMRIVPNLDGTGFVNLGRSSRDLSKQEMADLLTLMEMFAAKHGVRFADDPPVTDCQKEYT